jgi:hypothetical protein
MSGAQIAAEVNAALLEVARDVGDGEFLVTLRQPPVPPADPWGQSGGSPVETELRAMVSSYPQTLIDGTLIQQNDRRVMLSAVGPKPSAIDSLIIAGVSHRIISVQETGPSGVALYYVVQARV